MIELEQKYKNPDAKEIYHAERELLREIRDDNGKGVKYGLYAGLTSFLVLRRGPPLIARWLARRGGGSTSSKSGSYQFGSEAMRQQQASSMTTKTTTTQSQFGSGSFNNNASPLLSGSSGGTGNKVTNTFFWKVASFAIDVILSLNVAAFVGNRYTDVDGLLDKMAEAPLLEGRSIASEELCGDFIKEYRSIPPEFWATADEKSPYKVFAAIEKFAYNCKRRQVYEQQLKDEGAAASQIRFDGLQGEVRQLGSSNDNDEQHIPIPSPGVPPNIHVTLDNNDDEVISSPRRNDGDDDFVMDQQVSNEFGDFEFQSVDKFMGDEGAESDDNKARGHDWSSIDDFENGDNKRRK